MRQKDIPDAMTIVMIIKGKKTSMKDLLKRTGSVKMNQYMRKKSKKSKKHTKGRAGSMGLEFEHEREAMLGNEMPKELRWPEQVLYLSLRMLYEQYKKGIVSREIASGEKKSIYKTYGVHKALDELQESTNDLWKRIDMASAEYAKNPSVETADKLYEEIYRVKRKEV